MYQSFKSYRMETPSSEQDSVTLVGVSLFESESEISMYMDSELKEKRSGRNLETVSEDELQIEGLSPDEVLGIKELLQKWLDSKSQPSFSRELTGVSGKYIEDEKQGQFRGPTKKETQTEFDSLKITIGTAGLSFQVSDSDSAQFNFPASVEVKRGSPKDFDNISELNSTLFDYFNIEYEGDLEDLDIDVPPNIDAEGSLDDELRRRAVSEFDSGHYQSSVRTAFTVLEERVREMGGFPTTAHGSSLIQDAFHYDDGELSFGLSRAEKEGVMFLYRGAFQALRNPVSHRFIEDVDESYARDAIHTVNLLLRLLDESTDE